MKAIRIHRTGPADLLQLEEVDTPVPGAGEVLVRVVAAGVNYADIAQRQGRYLQPTPLPTILGLELSGVVWSVGPGVTHPVPGSQVVGFGDHAYAEYALVPAQRLFPVGGIPLEQAVSLPVQGTTAYQVLHESARLQAGESVLVHAAAGGVGAFAVQIAKLLGASKVIATAGSELKLEIARRLGADETINYRQPDWPQKVLAATEGRGAEIILEMIGGQTALQSLQCLAPFGRMIVFGAVSGQPAELAMTALMAKNQELIGYWLTPRLERQAQVARAMESLLAWVTQKQLRLLVSRTYLLSQAREAHTLIEERRSAGKLVLLTGWTPVDAAEIARTAFNR